jgi:glycerol-3-phosphate dehydrogenase
VTDDVIVKLFGRPYFYVKVIRDVAGVFLAGALKNISVSNGWVKSWRPAYLTQAWRVGVKGFREAGGLGSRVEKPMGRLLDLVLLHLEI